MQTSSCHATRFRRPAGFTMVELLIVVVIISILLTLASIGLGNMGGNPVVAGVTNAEAIFDEARNIAISKGTKARVIVATDLTNNAGENLRKISVVYENTGTGGGWVFASRGITLPKGVYFSQALSKRDHQAGTAFGETDRMSFGSERAKSSFVGSYLFYEFNAEGICSTPGASFVIGAGAKAAGANPPRVTASSQRDFGGFLIWRNGRTSAFNGPNQISATLPDVGNHF